MSTTTRAIEFLKADNAYRDQKRKRQLLSRAVKDMTTVERILWQKREEARVRMQGVTKPTHR